MIKIMICPRKGNNAEHLFIYAKMENVYNCFGTIKFQKCKAMHTFLDVSRHQMVFIEFN